MFRAVFHRPVPVIHGADRMILFDIA